MAGKVEKSDYGRLASQSLTQEDAPLVGWTYQGLRKEGGKGGAWDSGHK